MYELTNRALSYQVSDSDIDPLPLSIFEKQELPATPRPRVNRSREISNNIQQSYIKIPKLKIEKRSDQSVSDLLNKG